MSSHGTAPRSLACDGYIGEMVIPDDSAWGVTEPNRGTKKLNTARERFVRRYGSNRSRIIKGKEQS